MTPGPTAVLFDIDGTLVDQARAEAVAAGEFLAHYGRLLAQPCGVEEFCRHWRAAREEHLPAFLERRISYSEYHRRRIRELFPEGDRLSDREADRRFRSFLEPYRRAWKLFDDVGVCLQGCRGVQIAVLSNGNGRLQRDKLAATGIADRFNHILISDELGSAKPNPAAFTSACARLGVAAPNCLYVGDDLEADARAARRAGLQSLWLARRGLAEVDDVAVIRSLADLPRAAGLLRAAV